MAKRRRKEASPMGIVSPSSGNSASEDFQKKKSRRRKVGRPKKRGRKKAAKSRSSKGFATNKYSHIRSLIWKTHRSDFRSWADTAKLASEVYADCKLLQDCSDEDILGYYLERRGYKDRIPAEPEIAVSLYTEPQFYWEFSNLPLKASPRYLWVVSPMLLPAPAEFLAINYDYKKHFREFVQWCNLKMRQAGIKDTDQEGFPMFILSKPNWNFDKKRWETEVFSCDAAGNRFDYGFEPTGDISEDGDLLLPGEAVDLGVPTVIAPTAPKEAPEDATVKAERQRLEIESLKLKLKADQQRLEIEKMRAQVEIKKAESEIKKAEKIQSRKSIRMLEQSKKDLFSQIREAKEMGLGSDVINALSIELTTTIQKLNELKSKLD